TDGACASAALVHEIEPRKTPEQLQQERQQARDALERQARQQQADNAAADAEARRQSERDRARAAQAHAQAPGPWDGARSAACAQARRQLERVGSDLARSPYEQDLRLQSAQRQFDLDCLGPQGAIEIEKARAAQPRIIGPAWPLTVPQRPVTPAPAVAPTPRGAVQCNVFRCTDEQGQVFPPSGPRR
ncbi:MAG: DUF4124 domain-containing protein, partial [Burkholderiaceae bacterium]|nr:DUF4124 domain-containing protein [Burkholderiaceae bacterium]